MCCRFALFTEIEEILAQWGIAEVEGDYLPRYNVAPTQNSLVATNDGAGLRLRSMHWGLLPHWARDDKLGTKLFNARSETAAEKPAFCDAFARRRCLVLANGFYEWSMATKQPWFIRPQGRELFAFAGLWDRWTQGDDQRETFTILTISPNDFMSSIHERMPVILPRNAEREWLETGSQELLQPYPEPLEGWEVSKLVNRVACDGPELIERFAGQTELTF